MSLPADSLASQAYPSGLLMPDALGRRLRAVDYERGGVALSDPSLGLNAFDWRARISGGQVFIAREPYDTEVPVLMAPGISELSLAFDQNMRPMIAHVALGRAKLWWYDTTVPGEVLLELPEDARSPFVTLDDKRPSSIASNVSDVLLFYLRSNRLCYRQQRERFQTERTLAWFDGAATSISKAGMNSGGRVQVEIVGLQNRLATGAVLAGWTAAQYLASVTSISGAAPDGIATGDLLYAAVMHRSALTTPAGWSLVASQACTNGTTAQTLSILRKSTAAPADSGAVFAFTQATPERMGLAYFVVRGTSGTVAAVGSPLPVAVDSLATNTVTAAPATAAGTELIVAVATSINATASVTQPGVGAGLSLISGKASQCRLGVAYQRRAAGQTSAGRFTFDNGTPTDNGLAAITLRFS